MYNRDGYSELSKFNRRHIWPERPTKNAPANRSLFSLLYIFPDRSQHSEKKFSAPETASRFSQRRATNGGWIRPRSRASSIVPQLRSDNGRSTSPSYQRAAGAGRCQSASLAGAREAVVSRASWGSCRVRHVDCCTEKWTSESCSFIEPSILIFGDISFLKWGKLNW